jgi:hypothetical protein
MRRSVVACSIAIIATVAAIGSTDALAQSTTQRDPRAFIGVVNRDSTDDDVVHIGDKIALWVAGYTALSDTFAVGEGYRVRLPEQLPELTLENVRRSAVERVVTEHIAKYIKDPQVRATLLLRLALVGAFGKPGFINVPPDALLSDAIEKGGLTGTASLKKVTIRRDTKELMKPKDTQKAPQSGKTIASLQIRSGDEIYIGEERPSQKLENSLRIAGFLMGLIGVYAAFR